MIGVVADDLTGAAEVGAVGLRHGLAAQVVVKGKVSGGADLISIDTDSRSCSPEEAGRRAATAADALSKTGAAWVYKKVDSVLRGQVAAELEGVMKQLQVARILLVPANPGLGRTIRSGRYFVHGMPIDQTDFRDDPEFPRLTSEVRGLLGKSDSLPTHLGSRDQQLPASGLIIGQAETADDLRAWAGRCDNSTLAAGGAEFFGALLAAKGCKNRSPLIAAPAQRSGERQLFVCGSASASCKQFIHDMHNAGCPILSVEVNRKSSSDANFLASVIGTHFQSSPRVVLAIDTARATALDAGRSLVEELATVAALAARHGTLTQLYAEGGATAALLVRQLGWKSLNVVHELAPGVVTLEAAGRIDCQLTIKPGSYLWPEHLRAPATFES